MLDNKTFLVHLLSDKYKSSSTCLVLAFFIRFADNITMLRLSHHTIAGFDRGNDHSASKDEIHVLSATKWARFLYSASVLDLETACCFLDSHEIRLEPKNTQNVDTDRLSSG